MSEDCAIYGEPHANLPGLRVRVQKLSPEAVLPAYATAGAACMDLCALEDATVPSGGYAHIRTGLAFEVPVGHVMLINSRSGHGFKSRVRLMNSQGVIDSDYRGEVQVGLANDSAQDFQVQAGDRIAQFLIVPYPQICLEEVIELGETARGAGGFGSTGA